MKRFCRHDRFSPLYAGGDASALQKLLEEFRALNVANTRSGGRTAALDRHLDALWHISRNPCCWRALPGEFGPWSAVFQFFNRLSHAGFFDFLHERLVCGDGAEAVFFDSTHRKVHQHAHGMKKHDEQAVGKSPGGLDAKIHAAADILGWLAAKLILTPGNVSDHTAAVADKGYDKKAPREALRARGCEPRVPRRSHVKNPEPYDAILYRSRHVSENLIQRLKVFRRVATRYEKTKRMFLMFTTFALSCHYTKFRLWPSM